MLPNESQPKLKRYRFNSQQQKHNNQQAVICVWISGLILIIFLILGGIKLVGQNQSAQTILHSRVSRHASKSNRSQRNLGKNSSRINSQSKVNNQSTPSHYDNERRRPISSQPSFHKQRFTSVTTAKDWARATQQRWLHDGYSNYVVRSDGQGNYYLQFTK